MCKLRNSSKYYAHSFNRRTGIVYNVTPAAVGVIVYKVVGNRYLEKRVNLRVEHVRHSACRQEFLDRVKSNHEAHVKAKESGGTYSRCIGLIWLLILFGQNVSTSDAYLHSPENHAPFQQPTTHH